MPITQHLDQALTMLSMLVAPLGIWFMKPDLVRIYILNCSVPTSQIIMPADQKDQISAPGGGLEVTEQMVKRKDDLHSGNMRPFGCCAEQFDIVPGSPGPSSPPERVSVAYTDQV